MDSIFFFATLREAAATISALQAVQQEDRYVFPGGEVRICGMGMKAAAQEALRAPTQDCRWVNIGIAGCLDNVLPVGTAVTIGRIGQLQWDQQTKAYQPVDAKFLELSSSPATLFTPLFRSMNCP